MRTPIGFSHRSSNCSLFTLTLALKTVASSRAAQSRRTIARRIRGGDLAERKVPEARPVRCQVDPEAGEASRQ
jgi:hypothetical protein